ncbi:MAG: STAS domain-containing protein [Rubrivivax sp.]|nr:STAS domain-containing protein [Rubrivivax sp.]
MAENESFFRKVVRFVANPATDWTELHTRQEETRELELEKSELKAMIERKRRNDFVRKREFDVLRRVRREGLSPEQLAALGGSSRIDDSEARLPDSNLTRTDGVKAKIDAIEQQMVGDGGFNSTSRRPTGFKQASTVPAVLTRRAAGPSTGGGVLDDGESLPPLPPLPEFPLPPTAAPAPVQMSGGLPPLVPLSSASFDGAAPTATGESNDFRSAFAVDVNEVVHDPELDEVVIAFANADFAQCEDALQRIIATGSARAQHAETWLVLFDLYRATGQHQHFEGLAVDYAQQFGWSAPQWYSLPKLVADALTEEPMAGRRDSSLGDVGWVCPERLDIEAVARLRSQTLQMPLPWVFDWDQLRAVDAEAAMQLSALFRLWAGQALEMRWLAGDRLIHTLQEAAPTGVRDADPAFWLTRLDALRLANRADQFDEAAIDYCVTYEVSPPSWSAARCKVHISGSGLATRTPSLSMVSEVSTSFMESGLTDSPASGGVEVAHVELSGQLVGDISATLAKLQGRLGTAPVVSVSCARLIRVDFIAAGDLLNWVLSRCSENRAVHFVDAHRLVALFFGAMGINEHAKVQVRKV